MLPSFFPHPLPVIVNCGSGSSFGINEPTTTAPKRRLYNMRFYITLSDCRPRVAQACTNPLLRSFPVIHVLQQNHNIIELSGQHVVRSKSSEDIVRSSSRLDHSLQHQVGNGGGVRNSFLQHDIYIYLLQKTCCRSAPLFRP